MDQLEIQAWAALGPQQQEQVARLLDRVWPPQPGDAVGPLHNPALQPLALRLLRGGELVAYAAVLSQCVEVAGEGYLAQGLSCVACDPALQGQGLGGKVVAAATARMAASGADIGVFTCDPELLPFYRRHGWGEAPGVLLRGSLDAAAINSRDAGKHVLLRLWSARAQAHAADFGQAGIVLGLPPGEFW